MPNKSKFNTMDKNFAVAKSMTATLQPKSASIGLVGNLQGKKGSATGDIGNLAVPGAVDGIGLKALLGNGINQGLLELDGANYMVKGHAKKAQSKGRKKSAGGKKKTVKKASKSKGRKKSVSRK